MSKVITISRFFPKRHPRAGLCTFFVEKLIKSVMDNNDVWYQIDLSGKGVFDKDYYFADNCIPKHHTIRSGHRWTVGDTFSPRVWSGKPYRSPQIVIAPDITIEQIWNFEVKTDGLFYLKGTQLDVTSTDIPMNDGLDSDDFLDWFPNDKEFNGQIICWNKFITYDKN